VSHSSARAGGGKTFPILSKSSGKFCSQNTPGTFSRFFKSTLLTLSNSACWRHDQLQWCHLQICLSAFLSPLCVATCQGSLIRTGPTTRSCQVANHRSGPPFHERAKLGASHHLAVGQAMPANRHNKWLHVQVDCCLVAMTFQSSPSWLICTWYCGLRGILSD
jgi:hypothetical protein